jgi:hypothetical protein
MLRHLIMKYTLKRKLKTTLKAVLYIAVALTLVGSVQAYQPLSTAAYTQGDLLVGFTSANGTGLELIADLGQASAVLTNNAQWDLKPYLPANLTNMANVYWGVIGVGATASQVYQTTPAGNGAPNPINNIGTYNNVKTATAAVGSDLNGTTGYGQTTASTPDNGSWNGACVDGSAPSSWAASSGGLPICDVTGSPFTSPLSEDFYSSRIAPGAQTQLGTFTLSKVSTNILLTFNTLGGGGSSTNAYLTSLVLSPALTFTPTFASNVVSYAATEAYAATPTITVVNGDTTATNRLIYNNTTNVLTSGVASSGLALTLGVTNVAQVQVTAQDGVTIKTYQVNIVQQPSQTRPVLTNSVSGGTNLVLAWAADHLGYSLLMQTNNLNKGVSSNTNDWMKLVGSTAITTTNIPINKATNNAYYRLVYP